MCHMCSCVKSLIETAASEDLFEATQLPSSAARVEISDLSNETSGTSFVELLRKKFPCLEDPSETKKINIKLNFLLS